ncbi:fatty acid hydroxylase superfamily protein [Ferrovum sp. PN-J185]|nr:fatty acid hydroxylase superfamily protein [Ferrovum sp. PN-J185]
MFNQLINSPIWLTAFGAIILLLLERLFPLIKYEIDHKWTIRLFIYASTGIAITTIIGDHLFNQNKFSLFKYLNINFLYHLPPILQGLAGYFIITFIVYWWYRFRHYSNFLWTTFHQVHHSTYRIQALTAIYSHPFDFAATAVIVNFISYIVLGVDTRSAVFVSVITNFFDFWEHTNIRTPKWLGYIIVRPEMHRIHHEKEVHNNNYSIPIWDMLFGTYENSGRNVECGFEINKERQIIKLLTCHNVNKN